MHSHPRELSVIRHGQSAGNVANDAALASGSHQLDLAERDMDVALSDLGAVQASALSKWFVANECPDIVFSSPYVRAYETARIGLVGAGFDVPIVCDERLREREFGILDRLTKPGIIARHPEQAAARAFLGKMYHRPPGGESWVDVAARIRSFYRDLRLDHPGANVVVVTHQAVILLFRYVLEALTEDQVMEIDSENDIANAAVTTYRGDGDTHPLLAVFNDSSHIPAEVTTVRPDVPVAPR